MMGLKKIIFIGLGCCLFFANQTKSDSGSKFLFTTEEKYADVLSPYLYQLESICYIGEMGEVPYSLRALLEEEKLERDQGIVAIRYGQSKVISFEDEFFETSEEWMEFQMEENPKVVEAWKSYDTSSKEVLVISNLGPEGDGTELYLTIMPPCD